MNSTELIDILLVEDNPSDVELTLRALEGLSRSSPVHVINDGARALDFLFCRGDYADRSPAQRVKVVLLDLKLPKVGGLDVLKVIKADEKLRTIPVIVFSSSREETDVMTAYRYGANSYVVKPVEFEQFVHAVSQIGLYWLLLNEPAH